MGMEIGSGNSYQIPINYEGEGNYDVGGKKMSEEELNASGVLPPGITAANGQFRDSYTNTPLNSQNLGVVTNVGGDPPLPNVGGPDASAADVGAKVGWMGEINDASLMWMAMRTMAEGNMRDMKDAKDIKHEMQRGKAEAKKGEIKAKEEQIAAEKENAGYQLAFQVTAAAASAVAGGVGASGSSGLHGALSGSANALGQTISAAGNYWSKTSGPQAEADAKQVEQMQKQATQEIYDQNIESAKSNYEEAKEQFKLAMKIVQEHVERESQVVQKITS